MAVTLYPPYSAFPSFNEELYHVALSDVATTANFKYVYDVKIGGNLVSRLKVFPDPTTNKGICNVAAVVRNYWSSYFKPVAGAAMLHYTGADNAITYTIEVGEDINGSVTTNLASATYTAYNFVPYLFTDFTNNGYNSLSGRYGTTRDLTQLTYNGTEKLFISFLNVGVASRQATINNGVTSVTTTGLFMNSFAQLNLSPTAINNTLSQNFITDATQTWTVTINGHTAIVNRVCNQHNKVILYFLNQSGGYDTMPFRLVNKQSREAERKQFTKRNWVLVGDSMRQFDTNNIVSGGAVQFAVNQKVSYSLNSDFVTEQDYRWLQQLITSPEVYMDGGNYYYPVTIRENSWTERLRRTDKLFNLSLNIDVKETNSQFR